MSDAFEDDGEYLVVVQFAALAIAELADEGPEVHGEVPVAGELLKKEGDVGTRSGLDLVRDADDAKFSDVGVEVFRLSEAVCVSRHHVFL